MVVGKKHEIREKMVSSKNWQTLESFFFIFPDAHTYSRKDLFRKKGVFMLSVFVSQVFYSTGLTGGDVF